MNKREVVAQIREEFRNQFELLRRASNAAREDATDVESQAKSKYDTQGLEASYLAAGQATRAENLAEALTMFNSHPFPPFPKGAAIAEGALVELSFDGEVSLYLLAPGGGGMSCVCNGKEVTILGPNAPLRQQITGLKSGATLKKPPIKIRAVL